MVSITCNTVLKKIPEEQRCKAKILAIMNFKGGCGKTSLVDALAHRLIAQGYNTLVWDNDPQCNITQRLGIVAEDDFVDRRVAAFYKEITNSKYTDKTVSLPVSIVFPPIEKIGGTLGLMAGDPEAEEWAATACRLTGLEEARVRFRNRLQFYKEYFDYILIDTAPSIHNNSINDLTISVADNIIIPFDNGEAVAGLGQYLSWIDRSLPNNRPNIIFALTKYHYDTKDLQNMFHDGLPTRNPRAHNEYQCAMFRLMKSLLGDYVCNNGILERQVLRTHSYTGLPRCYDMKKKYDALCSEILKHVYTPQENAIDYWRNNKLDLKLTHSIELIESRRSRGVAHKYGTFQFRNSKEVVKC